jgi:imidazoleglycerol-phosphate dehydratase
MTGSLRKAEINRTTNETALAVVLNLDGLGEFAGTTKLGFLDHMLTLFARHSLIDLNIEVTKTDLAVDDHHLVEDLGIVLGQVFKAAVGDKKGIKRYGFFLLPMDECLVEVAVDLSGRAWFEFKDANGEVIRFDREKVGDLSTELVFDFWQSFARTAEMTLHINLRYGRNVHHEIEGIFKGVARALRMAVSLDARETGRVPSTKGKLEG